MTITEFLTARLDEDEQLAKQIRDDNSGEPFGWYDPVRVLREVAAKRAIVAEMSDRYLQSWTAATTVLFALAAIYSDHPDYDPAWSVG